MKPIIWLLVLVPILFYSIARAVKIDPLRDAALMIAFWTCLITCGSGARRAWSAGDKQGAIVPVAVFAGCWIGFPFLAGFAGEPILAYLAVLGPPVAIVLGFRLLLLYPPRV